MEHCRLSNSSPVRADSILTLQRVLAEDERGSTESHNPRTGRLRMGGVHLEQVALAMSSWALTIWNDGDSTNSPVPLALFLRAALQPGSTWHAWGFSSRSVGLCLSFHSASWCCYQPISPACKGPLDGTAIWFISDSSQLCIICRRAESALCSVL